MTILLISPVLLSVVCVLGVLGNGVVIWVTGFRMKKTVSTVWFLNLAVADFLVTAFLPLRITWYATVNLSFGSFMWKMDSLVFYMNMYASVFTLVVISVDRCVGVVWPLWARSSGHRTVRNASWVSLGVWVLALALSIPVAWYYDVDQSYASTPTGIIITNFLVGFVVPFSVIVFCRLRNTRSFKIIAAVITAFFLCWLPFHIILLIIVCAEAGLIEGNALLGLMLFLGYTITLPLALLNSCVNPLLYVFSQGFKEVFRCRSVLKVLEKAFAEEPPQTNNTPPDPALTQMITLSGIAGRTGPPGTQDPSA